jgi:leader peptidase (prepilin peptidase) / N-methyltransferase
MVMDLILKGLAGAMAGGAIGAYLATSAIRWGRAEGASLGRSKCDACHKMLGWHETVPIISFVCLGGKCAGCASHIDRFHLAGEVGGAVLLGGTLMFRPWSEAVFEGLMGLLLLWLALIDIKTLTLPNTLVLFVAGLGAIHAALANELMLNVFVATGMGGLLSGIAYGLYRLKGQTALGLGDIKLIMALSLWLGFGIVYMMVLASVIGLVHLMLTRTSTDKIAFGPALAASGIVVAALLPSMGAYAYG